MDDIALSWTHSTYAVLATQLLVLVLLAALIVDAVGRAKRMKSLRAEIAEKQPSTNDWASLLASLESLQATYRELQERVAQLEADGPAVVLATPASPSAPPESQVALTHDDAEAVSALAVRDVESAEPRMKEAALAAEVLGHYAAVVADSDLRRSFEQMFVVAPYRATAPGSSEFMAEPTDSPMIWAIAIGERWLVLPGFSPIKRWFNYRQANGSTAREVLGGAYEFSRGESALRIIEPAWATESNGRLIVQERGLLAGVP